MNRSFVRTVGSIVASFILAILLLGLAAPALAQGPSRVDQPSATGSLQSFPSGLEPSLTREGDLATLIGQIINFFLGFTALVAVIIIIYGGVQYLTSAGEPEKAKKGKQTIVYAVIGILVIILSYSLVNTIIGNLAGGDLAGRPGAPGAPGAAPVDQIFAAFSVTPFSGNLGTIFRLDAGQSRATSGRQLTYIWDFDLAKRTTKPEDGDPSDDQDSTERVTTIDSANFYKQPGEYVVRLVVSDGVLNPVSAQQTIVIVSRSPVAKLKYAIPDLSEPSKVAFDASGSVDPDGEAIKRYEWDFGDGDSYAEEKPPAAAVDAGWFNWLRFGRAQGGAPDGAFDGKTEHIYRAKGNYNVELKVTDISDAVNQIRQQVKIDAVLGIKVEPTKDSSFVGRLAKDGSGFKVKFVASSKQGVVFEWEFGDGGKDIVPAEDGESLVEHSYQQAGNFKVKVTVSDIEGNENSIIKRVYVGSSNRPIAVAIVDGMQTKADGAKQLLTQRNVRLTFSGENSLAADGSKNLGYSWDFGDQTGLSQGTRVIHSFREISARDAAGDSIPYNVTLTVTDKNNQRTVTDKIAVIVANKEPIAVLLVSNTEGGEPLLVNLDASSSSDPDGRLRYSFRILAVELAENTAEQFLAAGDTVAESLNSLNNQFKARLSHDGSAEERTEYYAYLLVEDDDKARVVDGPVMITVTKGEFAPRITIQSPFERVFNVDEQIVFRARVIDHQGRQLPDNKLTWEAVSSDPSVEVIAIGQGASSTWNTKGLKPGAYTVNALALNTVAGNDYEGRAQLNIRLFIPVVARLQTTPLPNRAGEIVLSAQSRQVSFNASESTGGLAADNSDLGYRLDADLAFDGDGDGIKNNDSDVTFDGSGVGSYNYSTDFYKGGEVINVRLVVRDSLGHEKTVDKVVRIERPVVTPAPPTGPSVQATPGGAKPTARIQFVATAGAKDVNFDGSFSTAASGAQADVTSFNWDFDLAADSDGDGNPVNDLDSTNAKASHSYPAAGVYRVQLKVTDRAGNTDSVTKLVVLQ